MCDWTGAVQGYSEDEGKLDSRPVINGINDPVNVAGNTICNRFHRKVPSRCAAGI